MNIDDDILRLAKRMAAERNAKLGTVLSELARKGLKQDRVTGASDDLPAFSVSQSAPYFSTEDVAHAEDEE